jgi:hypothetical protein|tara:strand:+ start:401 stop:544 length:144 start_codon:yes stop_codon:yes gene_type:complete
MVHNGPWPAAGWVPEERRKIFNKLQAASRKRQAASVKLSPQLNDKQN